MRNMPMFNEIFLTLFLVKLKDWILFSYKMDQIIADEFQKKAYCIKCEKKTVFLISNYPRKPRGIPNFIDEAFRNKYLSNRFSFLCRTCKKRHTPESVRYLGKKIYIESLIFLLQIYHESNVPAPREKKLNLDCYPARITRKRWPLFFKDKIWDSEVGKNIRRWFLLNPEPDLFFTNVYFITCTFFKISELYMEFSLIKEFFKSIFEKFKKISIPSFYRGLFIKNAI